jgi:deazaflavin-dependent oxidoreductase (nitroreductase family)
MSRNRRAAVLDIRVMGTGRYTSDVGAHPAHLFTSITDRYKRLLERAGHTRWFAAGMRVVGARVDARLYRLSRGRLSIAGPALFPVLLLTSIGRRSGRPRTTPLIYVRDGDNLIVSSESFGQTRPAAWTLNLAADPYAFVQVGRYRGVARACDLSSPQRHKKGLRATSGSRPIDMGQRATGRPTSTLATFRSRCLA